MRSIPVNPLSKNWIMKCTMSKITNNTNPCHSKILKFAKWIWSTDFDPVFFVYFKYFTKCQIFTEDLWELSRNIYIYLVDLTPEIFRVGDRKSVV